MPERIPDGWREATLGELVEERNDRVGRAGKPIVLSSTKHCGLIPSDEYFHGRTIYSNDLSNYKRVERNWFAYATNHLAEGSIGLQREFSVACVSPIYTVLRCREAVDPAFLYYILKSPRLVSEYGLHEQASVDRRGAVRFRDFSRIRITLPCSLSEQQRIAGILDTLDEQIHGAGRILNKLYLLRASIIRDELASLIYEEYSTVGNLFSIKAGITLGPYRRPGKNACAYLRVANVQRERIELSDVAFLQASFAEREELKLVEGDLLVVEGHASSDEIGRCALVGVDATGLLYQNHLFRLRSSAVEPHFALLWLNSDAARAYWRRMCVTSSGLHTINSQMLKAMPFPLVQAEEQVRVVSRQWMLVNQFDEQRDKLAKLRLLKHGLMDDLLMGRVRAAADGGLG